MSSSWSDYWAQRISFGFSPFRQIWLEEYLPLCKMLCEKFSLRNILDVGCGTGVSGSVFTFYGAHSVLCDVDRWALKVTKKFFKEYPNVSFVLADGFHLPFKKGAFDLALSEGLYEHFNFNDNVKLLKEKRECSKMAMVMVPNSRSVLYRMAKLLIRISGRTWAFGGEMERDVPKKELLEAMNEAGFRVAISDGLGHTGHIATFFIVLLPRSARGNAGHLLEEKNTLTTSLMHSLISVVAKVFFMPDENYAIGVGRQ